VRRVAEQAGPWAASLALVVSFLVFALAGVYTIRQQDHVNQKLCQSTVTNRAAVRSTWLAAEELVASRTDQAQKDATRAFFQAVLRPIPPLRCVDNKPVPKED